MQQTNKPSNESTKGGRGGGNGLVRKSNNYVKEREKKMWKWESEKQKKKMIMGKRRYKYPCKAKRSELARGSWAGSQTLGARLFFFLLRFPLTIPRLSNISNTASHRYVLGVGAAMRQERKSGKTKQNKKERRTKKKKNKQKCVE